MENSLRKDAQIVICSVQAGDVMAAPSDMLLFCS